MNGRGAQRSARGQALPGGPGGPTRAAVRPLLHDRPQNQGPGKAAALQFCFSPQYSWCRDSRGCPGAIGEVRAAVCVGPCRSKLAEGHGLLPHTRHFHHINMPNANFGKLWLLSSKSYGGCRGAIGGIRVIAGNDPRPSKIKKNSTIDL